MKYNYYLRVIMLYIREREIIYPSICTVKITSYKKSTHTSKTHVDPFLYKGHYSWIENFSRFCGKFKTNGKRHTHYCKHCLQGYTSEKPLENHLSMGCAEVTTCKPCMPKEENAISCIRRLHALHRETLLKLGGYYYNHGRFHPD